MAWLHQFFQRTTCKEQPTSTAPEAETASSPKSPGSTTVMQLVAEETIMAVAQWLVKLVNHHIQATPKVTPKAPVESTPAPEVNSTTVMEDVLSKFGKLVEQLYEREQQLIPLENRLQQIEAALIQENELKHQLQKSVQLIDRLNQRLVRVEDFTEKINISEIAALTEKTERLTQHVDQSSHAIALLDIRMTQLEVAPQQTNSFDERFHQIQQGMAVLEHRMRHLERLLARFSVVPKLVEENRHGINSLRHQLKRSQAFVNGDQALAQNGSFAPKTE